MCEVSEKIYREGIEAGRISGLKEGISEGRIQSQKEAAIGFYNIGITVAQIAKVLNLPVETIQEWIQESNK